MKIGENITYFLNDTYHTVKDVIDTLESPKHKDLLSNVKYYGNKFFDITNRTYTKTILHFPKFILIATVVSSIVSVLFISFSSFFSLGMNIYFICKYKNLILKSIKTYNDNNVSEWTSSAIEKQKIIAIIDPIKVISTS